MTPVIALAYSGGPPDLPPPSGPHPPVLHQVERALAVCEKQPKWDLMDPQDLDEVRHCIGIIPEPEFVCWLRRVVVASEGVDAFGWAEVFRAEDRATFFSLLTMEVLVEEDWYALPSTPAECLTWAAALLDFHEALAFEDDELMENNWQIADGLRHIVRQLRRLGFRPSHDNVPDRVMDMLPAWYND